MNDCVWPLAIAALPGATVMDCKVAAVTVSTAVLLVMAPDVAVMLEVPMPRPVATPPALIEATEPLLVCQVTEPVTSAVLL